METQSPEGSAFLESNSKRFKPSGHHGPLCAGDDPHLVQGDRRHLQVMDLLGHPVGHRPGHEGDWKSPLGEQKLFSVSYKFNRVCLGGGGRLLLLNIQNLKIKSTRLLFKPQGVGVMGRQGVGHFPPPTGDRRVRFGVASRHRGPKTDRPPSGGCVRHPIAPPPPLGVVKKSLRSAIYPFIIHCGTHSGHKCTQAGWRGD